MVIPLAATAVFTASATASPLAFTDVSAVVAAAWMLAWVAAVTGKLAVILNSAFDAAAVSCRRDPEYILTAALVHVSPARHSFPV